MNMAQPASTWTPPVAQAAPNRLRVQPHAMATGLVLVFMFLLVSRTVEIIPELTGINTHLILLLLPFVLLASLFSGELGNAMKTPVVVMFTAFTIWLCFATLASTWKGGSARLLVFTWIESYLSSIVLVSLISTLEQCRKLFYTLAFALLPILFQTVVFYAKTQGRDASATGSLGNPNDLAFAILLLLPFAVFVIQSESLLNWKALVCVPVVIYGLIKTLRTGSRSALLTLVVCFLIVLITGKARTKLRLLAVGGVIGLVGIAAVPRDVLLRWATVFDGTSYEHAMSVDELSAVDSTRAREMLFHESVRLMLEHPVLGVGPGVFMAALSGEQEKRGEHGSWHEAHNSFVQVGSEAGLPAFAIYLAIWLYCLKRTVSTYRRARKDPKQLTTARMAACLSMSLIAFGVCAAFGNYSYSFHLPVLAGLVQAFDLSVRREAKEAAAVAAVPVNIPPVNIQPSIQAPKPQAPENFRHPRPSRALLRRLGRQV